MGDVVSLPRAKRARDKKEQRKLAAYARLIESPVQLDILLDQDLKLRGNPTLRASVRAMLVKLNPKLQETIQ